MSVPKTEIAKFRLTPDELYDIDTRAYELKISRSELLRRMCFEKEITVYDFSELDSLSGEIGRIGTNINQIARKLNMGGQLNKDNAEFLKASIEMIHKSLRQIYENTKVKARSQGG